MPFDTLNWWWSDERMCRWCISLKPVFSLYYLFIRKQQKHGKVLFTDRRFHRFAIRMDGWKSALIDSRAQSQRMASGEKKTRERFPRTNNWYHFWPLSSSVSPFTSCGAWLGLWAIGNVAIFYSHEIMRVARKFFRFDGGIRKCWWGNEAKAWRRLRGKKAWLIVECS